MKAALRTAWASRAPRERLVIAVLAAVLVAARDAALVVAADRARAQLGVRVAALRTQSALLEQRAAEYQRLRSTTAPSASATDLRTLIRERVDAARLSGALTLLEAPDAEHVRVAFGAMAFADWLDWVAALQAQQVRLESARIEALAAPGLVSVTATFARSGPQ
ncbi:MAG: type II secretion system protein GspM [Burkholderiales bacterium]